MRKLLIYALCLPFAVCGAYIFYMWVTYESAVVTAGQLYGLSIGDTKREAYEKIPNAFRLMTPSAERIYIYVEADECSGRILAASPGRGFYRNPAGTYRLRVIRLPGPVGLLRRAHILEHAAPHVLRAEAVRNLQAPATLRAAIAESAAREDSRRPSVHSRCREDFALGRQMFDRRDAAQTIGQPLQQGEAVAAHGCVVDVDHHAVEERIHLRT